MARPINRLSTRTIQAHKEKGRYADGGGLYLHVESAALKRWVFVYQWQKRRREMGLGKFGIVTLAEARAAAHEARRLVHAGKNPMMERRTLRGEVIKVTFGSVATSVIATLEAELSSKKHLAQWKVSLEEAAANLTPLPVDEVDTENVLETLRPIWSATPETASRVRGRIERVLDAAKAQGLRTGDNPARWRGHLSLLLPKRGKLTRGHHAAMPFAQVTEFMGYLRDRPATAARALEFAILTAARTGEVIGAQWHEFDLNNRIWTIPAGRMKARVEHRVPLSLTAIEVLIKAAPRRSEPGREASHASSAVFSADALLGFVFPGSELDRPLSNMAMDMLLRRMNSAQWTVHGFRSTFRDWAGDMTDYPREIVEAALAHTIGNAVEKAYRRGDALEKRRELMASWAEFCGGSRTEATTTLASETVARKTVEHL